MRSRVLLSIAALVLTGCAPAAADPTPTVTAVATNAPTSSAPTSTLPPPDGTFQNPVFRQDFADPAILRVGDTYYAYATNASGRNVTAARSTDLVNWELLPDAMPALPKWAKLTGGLTWAPEVIEIDGTFVLYFTTRDKESNKQCVGVATSDRPEGKFRSAGDEALVCQAQEGGTIDASPFRDADGTLYLYYKNDGNCCGIPTYLYVQKLSADGLTLEGEATRLVRNDVQWEGGVVEAPTMVLHDGGYYLFFSANNYAGHEYAVGYATCVSALGPCEDAPENPILASRLKPPPMIIGPGHQTVLDLDGQTWLLYHAWEVIGESRRGDRRFLYLDRLDWVDGKPVVRGPTTDPQAVP